MTDHFYRRIDKYVTQVFKQNTSSSLRFHNLCHTKNVVKNAMNIVRHYNIAEQGKRIVYIAAWFHDTGYLFMEPQYHEEASCLIMEEFASGNLTDQINIAEVSQCIMATKFRNRPENMLQNITADADVFHFGSEEFPKINHRVLEETVLKTGRVDIGKFTLDTIERLKEHRFFTGYCRTLLNIQKEKNIIEFKKRLYV